jgi:cytoskeleton protein RodZ
MAGDIQIGGSRHTSPGAVLAAARVAQGITVERVAEKLRLSTLQIKAIEADDFAALPGGVFARGFVRNYARLLNLDATPLLSAMAPLHASDKPPSEERLLRDVKGVVMDAKPFRGVPVAAVVIALVVGLLAFYEFAFNETPATRPSTQANPAPSSSAVTTPFETLTPAAPLAADPSLSQEGAPKPANGAAGASRGLHFLFNRESWVEVRDGVGNILFSKINLPGSEQRVVGEPPFSIIVGSAKGVQLAYNGHPVDLAAHATEDVARLRLE